MFTYSKQFWFICIFILLVGCTKPQTVDGPQFERFNVKDLDVLRPGGQQPAVLDQVILSAGGSQEFSCPWWSTKCWCDGGAGSTDCNDLIASGKCGNSGIDTGTSAGGGNAGTCNREPGQQPCSGITGTC